MNMPTLAMLTPGTPTLGTAILVTSAGQVADGVIGARPVHLRGRRGLLDLASHRDPDLADRLADHLEVLDSVGRLAGRLEARDLADRQVDRLALSGLLADLAADTPVVDQAVGSPVVLAGTPADLVAGIRAGSVVVPADTPVAHPAADSAGTPAGPAAVALVAVLAGLEVNRPEQVRRDPQVCREGQRQRPPRQ